MDATRTSCRTEQESTTRQDFFFITEHSLLVLVAHRYLPLAWPKSSWRATGLGHYTTVHVAASVISRVHHTHGAEPR